LGIQELRYNDGENGFEDIASKGEQGGLCTEFVAHICHAGISVSQLKGGFPRKCSCHDI
jgi:hypothetical protein